MCLSSLLDPFCGSFVIQYTSPWASELWKELLFGEKVARAKKGSNASPKWRKEVFVSIHKLMIEWMNDSTNEWMNSIHSSLNLLVTFHCLPLDIIRSRETQVTWFYIILQLSNCFTILLSTNTCAIVTL